MKEKIIAIRENSKVAVTYDYTKEELQDQNLSILPRKLPIKEYIKIRNNTISFSLRDGANIEVYHDTGNGFKAVPLPVLQKIANYKIMCKKGGRFEGIQAITETDIITGGNVVYHQILRCVTRKKAVDNMEKIKADFPQYEFKISKV